jgi:hypothetical protein
MIIVGLMYFYVFGKFNEKAIKTEKYLFNLNKLYLWGELTFLK